jgi:uncharacterized protein with von Willebrand factor type A (vWA) domain
MDIQISVQNPQKAIALLEFLKSFEMIDKFKILKHSFSKAQKDEKEVSRFDKFYGSTKTGLSIDEIDEQLNILRKEWERDF